jgi:hypothetical protein
MSLTAGHAVGTADPARWRELSAVLAEAFRDDPVFGWLLPDGATRPEALRRFFALETRHIALPHRQSIITAGPARRPAPRWSCLPGTGAPRSACRRCTRPVTCVSSVTCCPAPWAP